MTLSIKPRHEEDNRLSDKELVRRLNSDTAFLIIFTSCIGVVTAIMVPLMLGFIPPLSSTEPSLSATDLGSVAGFVMNSDGVPIEGASVAIYKHMPLINSADKNTSHMDYVLTESDGSYSFDDLPSGVYRFTVTYPDRVVQIIDNYAVWPGSSSSHVFAAE